MLPDLTPEQAAAFWRRGHRSGRCLLWSGPLDDAGYGVWHRDRRSPFLAHRLAYVLRRGPIPAGMHVCHRCDIRSCFAPAHLFVATIAENMRDRTRKGRSRNQWSGKLSYRVQQLSLWNGPTLEEVFWSRLDRSGPCWLWTGYGTARGYGVLDLGKTRYLAHRLAYELFTGPIPAGLWVLHDCDVPACCNPAHLHLGTRQQNAIEARVRGRMIRGERHPFAKLDAAAVRGIRAAYAGGGATMRVLADRFGVNPESVHAIVHRRTWAHLD